MLKLVTWPLKLIFWLAVIATPILAVWMASSLAVYLNGPTWLAIAVGALLFPGLPLLWDAWATRRFNAKQAAREEKGDEPKERILTFGNRLILRTLFVNLVVIAALIGLFPERGFTALSTRGDWPLDHAEKTATVEQARDVTFRVASSLEVFHNWARENPYDDGDEITPEPDTDDFGEVEVVEETTDPDETTGEIATGEAAETEEGSGGEEVEEPSVAEGMTWPMPNEIHPLIAEMPEGTDTSVQAVAKYIAANEDDPFMRVKAMHDFVTDRVAYDLSTSGVKQDAQSVFARKTAVCEGYARLLVELGREIPEEIVYIPGVSRGLGGEVSGGGHAWNGAKIDGKWYLIDPTWNAGFYNDGVFEKKYRTDYLFTPPDIFVVDHLPDNERWQLKEEPISRGEFIRRPMMRTGFYREGLVLLDPDRSQISVEEKAVITVANPRRRKVMASLVTPSGKRVSRCDIIPGRERERIECAVPNPGKYQVQMFAGDPSERSFPFVGQIEVVR